MKKVKNVSTAKEKIIDFIESISFSMSALASVSMISYGLMDYGIDKHLDSIYAHPKAYALCLASPVIVGYLITKFDPDSITAQDISEIKPKIRKK